MYDFVVNGNIVGRSFVVGGDDDVLRKCRGGESFGGLSLRDLSVILSLLRDISLKKEGSGDDDDDFSGGVSRRDEEVAVVVVLLLMSHSLTYFFSL